MTALFLISLALVTKHPSSGVNQQGLEIEHVMIEWNEQTGTPSVLYASIRGEDLSTKRKFDGIQFTVDIGFSAHPPAMRGGRPKCGRYLVVDGEKTDIPTIFVGSMRRVGEAADCNAKELAFSAVSEIPSRDLREARKASSEAIRFPAKSKVHMIAIAICDYSLGLIQDKPVASLTVSESETVSRCRVIGPMPPAPESLRER